MKRFKIWSTDLGYPEEDAKIVTPLHDFYDIEDTIDQYIESRYYDWETPEGPWDMIACEVSPEGEKSGDVQTFSVSVDWSPNFYISKKT